MKLTKKAIFIAPLIAILAFGCGQGKKKSETTEETSKIKLTKAPASPAYADARLALKSANVSAGDSSFAANFDFEVTNYDLGMQTPDAANRGIANSGKGQHIHFIVNNGPYSAHYEPTFSKEMEEGNYVILAFLSRSYHESVKNANSYIVDVVTVGDPQDSLDVDFSDPHMFYSRPKGTYSGKDTEKVLLDFFLLNTDLSSSGNRVKATINGEEFFIDEWAPYYIEGLDKGVVKIKLELIDSEGNGIPGPFNVVERKVTLE